ncbi:MAG: glucose-1-phosphate cytidylyltransferase [bacterium]
MKVVLFCGGLGTRLREHSETIPKPMVTIGARPIMWHLMKYYAHYGHTEFILCLGYRGDLIKEYFLNYDECLSNDFVLSEGGRRVRLYGHDIENWTITFADTGLHTNIGQRLRAVEKYLGDDEIFLANYSDGLSDLPLPEYLTRFEQSGRTASLLGVRPRQSFTLVEMGEKDLVQDLRPIGQGGLWINGGFFAFRRRIFEYIKEGEEVVEEPFQRLIRRDELMAHRYAGFWGCMDTFKDKQAFDEMESQGNTPWKVWCTPGPVATSEHRVPNGPRRPGLRASQARRAGRDL